MHAGVLDTYSQIVTQVAELIGRPTTVKFYRDGEPRSLKLVPEELAI